MTRWDWHEHLEPSWRQSAHDVLESRTVSTGFVHSVAVEVLKPIEDVVAPPGATLLRAALEVDRAHLGIVELPVCDGCVRSYVLADAIAAEFAYPILGHFLARTLYPQLEFRETASASDDREKCITCFRGGSPIQTEPQPRRLQWRKSAQSSRLDHIPAGIVGISRLASESLLPGCPGAGRER